MLTKVAESRSDGVPKEIEELQWEAMLSASAEALGAYDPLFASPTSLMYLLVFFIDAHDRVAEMPSRPSCTPKGLLRPCERAVASPGTGAVALLKEGSLPAER